MAIARTILALGAMSALLGAAGPMRLSYPQPPMRDVPATMFGSVVHDPYRGLENANDPAVKRWASAETALATRSIHGLPVYAPLQKRVASLARASTHRSSLQIRNGRWVYLRQTPGQAHAALVARDGQNGAERVLFDPGSNAIESMYLSHDGSKMAFTTQEGGAESETLHVVDTATGKLLSDTLPHVGGGTTPTALAWDGDNKGFAHTLYPKNADGTYAKNGILVYHHVLGTDPATDTYLFGRGQTKNAEYTLLSSRSGNALAAFFTDGDGVHGSIYVRRNGGEFEQVAAPSDGIGSSGDAKSAFVGDTLMVVATGRQGRGELIGIGPGQTLATGTTVVPAGDLVIDGVVPVAGGFATLDVNAGDSGMRVFAADGTKRATAPIAPISTIDAVGADPDAGPIVVGYQNFTTPSRWYAYDPSTNRLADTGIGEKAPPGFAAVKVRKAYVPSLDGTAKIPVEIVGTPHGARTPTILYAYGAYGILSSPYFSPTLLAWLERGGVWAVAMVRGGGEYGEGWHQASRLATKTNSADDLAAVARWLGGNGYGDAAHLGINGGSAGGFLMGLALTRNPAQYRAVVSEVGIYDLIRVELTPNGAFNTPEFGTVKDPAQFAWMIKQSPYHNVHAGTAYPAVLFTTGENDPRVDPYMSRKMTAALQAATSSSRPILLLQKGGQGHGIGNSLAQRVESAAENFAFFWSQLAG